MATTTHDYGGDDICTDIFITKKKNNYNNNNSNQCNTYMYVNIYSLYIEQLTSTTH